MFASHQKAREIFDATVDGYQQRSDGLQHSFSSLIFQRRIAIVRSLLDGVSRGGRVLDFGMGPAVFGKDCTARGLSYFGIDISPVMVERARSLNLPNARFQVGDLESLDCLAGTMDVVLAIGLLDYLEHPEGGVRSLAECVHAGGQLILSFRNRKSVPRVLRDAAKTMTRLVPGECRNPDGRVFLSDAHEHAFDAASELQPLLSDIGFGGFAVDFFNCSPFFFNFPLPQPLVMHAIRTVVWCWPNLRSGSAASRTVCD